MENEIENFLETIDKIIEKDSRYPRAAYFFVRDALNATIKEMDENGGNKRRSQGGHITAGELLVGACHFAHEQFGPLAAELLSQWELDEAEDIGHIVFNLYEAGIFGKTDSDSRADFGNETFDLLAALRSPFQPREETIRTHANAVEAAREDFWLKGGMPSSEILGGMRELLDNLKKFRDKSDAEEKAKKTKKGNSTKGKSAPPAVAKKSAVKRAAKKPEETKTTPVAAPPVAKVKKTTKKKNAIKKPANPRPARKKENPL